MRPKAVLLDLDGTLVDSLPSIYQVYINFLKQYGIEASYESFHSLNGPSIQEIIEILKKRHGIEDSSEKMFREYETKTASVYKHLPLFPGVKNFLDFTREQGILLALVTAAPKKSAKIFLQQHALESLFSVVVSGCDVVKAKPDPAIYLRALQELCVQAGESLTVEDSEKGVRASLAALIPTLWIRHGQKTEHEMQGDLKTVQSWEEIELLLKELDG